MQCLLGKKKGRLARLDGRKDTIWIEEAADKNNRIALLSFDFNLEKWLDGTLDRDGLFQTLRIGYLKKRRMC